MMKIKKISWICPPPSSFPEEKCKLIKNRQSTESEKFSVRIISIIRYQLKHCLFTKQNPRKEWISIISSSFSYEFPHTKPSCFKIAEKEKILYKKEKKRKGELGRTNQQIPALPRQRRRRHPSATFRRCSPPSYLRPPPPEGKWSSARKGSQKQPNRQSNNR